MKRYTIKLKDQGFGGINLIKKKKKIVDYFGLRKILMPSISITYSKPVSKSLVAS